MARLVEHEDRNQVVLLPERLDDFVAEDKPVRVVDALVSEQVDAMKKNGMPLTWQRQVRQGQ